MSDDGGYRGSDPPSSRDGATSISAAHMERVVLELLDTLRHPVNGWEMHTRLGLLNHTVVPRLAPLRRKGLIILVNERRPGPPPKRIGQNSYVISGTGRAFLRGETPQPPTAEQQQAQRVRAAKRIFHKCPEGGIWAPKDLGLRFQRRNGGFVLIERRPDADANELERIKQVFAATRITISEEISP